MKHFKLAIQYAPFNFDQKPLVKDCESINALSDDGWLVMNVFQLSDSSVVFVMEKEMETVEMMVDKAFANIKEQAESK